MVGVASQHSSKRDMQRLGLGSGCQGHPHCCLRGATCPVLRTYTHKHVYTRTHKSMHTQTCAHKSTHIHIHTNTHEHRHTSICTSIYTSIYTHAHTPPLPHYVHQHSISPQAIENIDALTSLESLFLGKNKITKLQNLDALTNLTVLSMQVSAGPGCWPQP